MTSSTYPSTLSNLTGEFLTQFQQQVENINLHIAALSDLSQTQDGQQTAINDILVLISGLSKRVADAGEFLPAYDQRLCVQGVKMLGESLQSTKSSLTNSKPKKFNFKNKVTLKPKTISSKNPAPIPTANHTNTTTTTSVTTTALRSTTPTLPAIHLNHLSNQSVQISTAPAHSTSTLANLEGCTVDLTRASPPEAPLAGLFIRDVRASVVAGGWVRGAVHVTGLQGGTLAVACGQLRMHQCTAVDVYLWCGSEPVVEDVLGVRFAPLGERYMNSEYSNLPNLWDQVKDFKWLRSEHSPNWSIIPESERVDVVKNLI